MIARGALFAAALGVIALLAVSRHHHDACESARTTVFQVTLGHQPVSRQAAAVRQAREQCRGTTALVAVAGALYRQGRAGQALAVAQDAVAREPDSAAAWSAVATTAAAAHAPALARAADSRLKALDPLGRRSLNLSAGRSTR